MTFLLIPIPDRGELKSAITTNQRVVDSNWLILRGNSVLKVHHDRLVLILSSFPIYLAIKTLLTLDKSYICLHFLTQFSTSSPTL